MKIEPYLFFEGRCDEALAFYREALGAEVTMLMRYKESPEQGTYPPEMEDKVLHAEIRIGDAAFMVSDGHCGGQPGFEGFAVSLSPSTEREAERMFRELANEGVVHVPPAKTFFSPLFGMVTDRFGVLWMILMQA